MVDRDCVRCIESDKIGTFGFLKKRDVIEKKQYHFLIRAPQFSQNHHLVTYVQKKKFFVVQRNTKPKVITLNHVY